MTFECFVIESWGHLSVLYSGVIVCSHWEQWAQGTGNDNITNYTDLISLLLLEIMEKKSGCSKHPFCELGRAWLSRKTWRWLAKFGLYLKVEFFLIASHKIKINQLSSSYFWKIINIMHSCDLQRQRHGLSCECWVKKRLYIALQTLRDHQQMLPKRQSLDGMLLKESIARVNDVFKLNNIAFRVKW